MERIVNMFTRDKRIGVLGFGEVGSTISKAMAERGARILVYDVLVDKKAGERALESRINREGIELTTLDALLLKSQMILCVTTTRVAESVANQVAGRLQSPQVYVDLNSTSPAAKREIGRAIETSGADFVEGAILGAVGVTGARTQILMAGKRGKEVAKILRGLGLNTKFYSAEVGTASTFKMLRSIFSKGLEALMLELMIAGRRAGIEDDLWKDVTEFMGEHSFDQVVENWIRTHAIAYERRYHEMTQVVQTMQELDLEPVMSSATEAFFERSLSINFDRAFKYKPEVYETVISFMEKRLSFDG